MAITKGQGNPKWTRDEVILALDLYFDCKEQMPSSSDERVVALSQTLRSFPHHHKEARKESFRNPDGVAFKLQNIRQVATGKGLGNVSKMDKNVWAELGENPQRVKHLANLIKQGIKVIEKLDDEEDSNITFAEGKVVTDTHIKRERDPKLRKSFISQLKKTGALTCELCKKSEADPVSEAIFEVHHIIPLAVAGERQSKIDDLALLCANCHRIVHKAIALEKHWLSLEDVKKKYLINY